MNVLNQIIDCMINQPFQTGLALAIVFLPFIFLLILGGTK